MNLYRKILTGGGVRPPRWRDEKGTFVGWSRLMRNAPRAVLTGIIRVTLGMRPHRPWISYDATKVLSKFLNSNSTVLEFGSGMSTVWYAKKVSLVYSVEDHSSWYKLMKQKFSELGISNVNYHFANSPEEYAQFGKTANRKFDLIMVDGSVRSECIRNSLELLAPGGIFYLDNSDKHPLPLGGDTRIAEELLLNFAKERNCEVHYFTDFGPTQFFAEQALLIKS